MNYPRNPTLKQWKKLVWIVLAIDDIRGVEVRKYDSKIPYSRLSEWKKSGRKQLDSLTEVQKITLIEESRYNWELWCKRYGQSALDDSKEDVFEDVSNELNQVVIPEVVSSVSDSVSLVRDSESNRDLQNLQASDDTSYKLLESLKKQRIAGYLEELQDLQHLQTLKGGKLPQEYQQVSASISKCVRLISECTSPKDFNSLTQSLDRLIKLRKSLLGSVFGTIELNKTQSPTVNQSKHVHLHNAGIKGFDG